MVKLVQSLKDNLREDKARAQVLLATLTIVPTLLWLGTAGLRTSFGDDALPNLVYLVVVPPIAAFVLARRYRKAFASDVIAHSQFEGVAGIFGLACLMGVVLSAIGQSWETAYWAIGVLSAGATLWTIRRRRSRERT